MASITGIGAVGDGWGNGTTMATLFARQGASVFGCDINLEAANKAADQIRNDDQVTGHPCRHSGSSIVDVIQESIVSALIICFRRRDSKTRSSKAGLTIFLT